MRRKIRILLMLSILMMGLLWGKSPKIYPDQPAPDFVLLDQDSSLRKLSDYRGNWVVVYFYPKGNTQLLHVFGGKLTTFLSLARKVADLLKM